MSIVVRLCLIVVVSLLAACANKTTVNEKSKPSSEQKTAAVEDPYLWLEETDSAKAMDWVKARNAETVSKYANSADFSTMRDQILEVMDSKEKIPYVSKMGAHWYNFWRDKDPLARRVAPHDARRIPQGPSEVGNRDRSRRARHGRKGKLGVARRGLPASGLHALHHRVVARRRGCERAARVQPQNQNLGEGRLQSARSQIANGLDRQGPHLRRHRFRPGFDDEIELSAHREGMEARHAVVVGRDGVRRQGRRSVDPGLSRSDAGIRARFRDALARVLQQRNLSCAARTAS